MSMEVTTLGGGCFWCLEALYDELKGVTDVVSGYSGGHVKNPAYREVCNGTTGHAEVIQITFDNEVISFREILNVFFTMHDPTTLNRQGNDKGTQYRSAIYYRSPEQKAIAEETIKAVTDERIWGNPIVTEVTAFDTFYPAEAHHQEFYANNPSQGYCRAVIEPKVVKFRKSFMAKLKA